MTRTEPGDERDPGRAHWHEAAVATGLGGAVVPDPEELWLSRFDDATLLVLAVVAHAQHGTAREIRRATGRLPGATRLSLRKLQRAGLVERERRAGPDHWLATGEGIRLGVTPYVMRVLAAARPKWPGRPSDWSVGRFRDLGGSDGPPIFAPAYALADVHDPQRLGEVVRSGTADDQVYALTKLIALNDAASVPLLIEVAGRRGDDELLARQAVIALGHFNTAPAREALIEVAAGRDSVMREAAARALGRLRAREAVPVLCELTGFPSEPVRVAAIRALERIGDQEAASAIAGALADAHRAVRRSARRALAQLRRAAA